MQDRLVKEMRLAGISSIKDANKFVQQGDFIERHNLKFAVPPIQKGDAHKNIEGYDLYKLFCFQQQRVVTNDFTISYNGSIIQLLKHQSTIIRPKNRVIVCEHLDKWKTIHIRNCQLNFEVVGMRKKKLKPVDYVSTENSVFTEQRLSHFPFQEDSKNSANSQDVNIENRNFSLC
jgi:hypothetical protein